MNIIDEVDPNSVFNFGARIIIASPTAKKIAFRMTVCSEFPSAISKMFCFRVICVLVCC